MTKLKIGFDSFDDLLDALTVRKQRKRMTKAIRARKGRRHRQTMRRKRAKARKVETFMARVTKATPQNRIQAAAIGLAAAARGLQGEPGRWLTILRAMRQDVFYSAAELAGLIGLPASRLGMTIRRDMLARGYVDRIIDKRRYEARARGRATWWLYVRTELGAQIAKDGAPRRRRTPLPAAVGETPA